MEFGWLYDLWQIPSIKAAVVTIILGAILDVVRRLIVPRGRVAWGISHDEYFILPPQQPSTQQPQQTDPNQPEQPTLPMPLPPPPRLNVLIRQIFIQNVGRAVAEDVEITINFLPQHWHAFPPILQTVPSGQDRFFRLQTKMLNKREHFIISMFQAGTGNVVLPDVLAVRWKGGVAKQVPIVPRQKLPTWVERSLAAIFWFGVLSVMYVIIRLAIFIF